MKTINLTPAVVDLLGIRAGDRNSVLISVTSGGEPLLLTGYTITAQARGHPSSEDALAAVIEDVDEEAGTFMLRWPGEDVRTFLGTSSKFEGRWDVQIQSGEADPITIAAGKFQAELDVTR